MSAPEDDNKPGPSGRVRHDAGGRAVWEWAIDSGRHAIDSTSRLLKKLDVSSLRLVGDDEKQWEKKHGEPDAPAASPKLQARGEQAAAPRKLDVVAPKDQGFNPYDSRTPVRKAASRPATATPSTAPASRVAAAMPRTTVAPAEKPGLLARLFGQARK